VLDTFALVLKELPDAHLLMVGDINGTGLEQYAKQLGIQDSVRFIGQVPRKDVPRYLLAARCTVSAIPPLPMYILSSPTKVLESLALGIPVVANCEIHDQRELLENSGGGYAPPYQREEMAKALIDLLADPVNAKKRGQVGREYISTHRSYEALSKQLIGFYEELFKRVD
jgi:glycosyltransferase involved in cell wall biosynthesis